MSEDLIRRSDAIKAIASLHILADEEKIFKVYADNPHSMTTDFEGTLIDAINAIKSIPSADRPPKVVAQITFGEEKLREIVKEAVERFKEEYEIKPKQGEWIRTGRTNIYGGIEIQCSKCGDKVMVQHLEDEWFCRHCGADMGMKGADDE